MKEFTLGSLFDGSGGFPLAGMINGFKPVWGSEIEPYPLKVTTSRLPCMKQLGDITLIDGAKIDPVDIITFGSPCQDLSVAGKQAGIHDGKRSNLFFEAIRIIKEMRGATNGKYPRFAVWENVTGAFSSNRGKDFQAVLQALCETAEQSVSVPDPPKGKWAKAGCIVGDGYSIAWRVYDAQYWGVPQRRKRIYLVADFGSERAGEILFERDGVRKNSAKDAETQKRVSADASGSAEGSKIYSLQGTIIDRKNAKQGGDGIGENVSFTLTTVEKHGVAYCDKNITDKVQHVSYIVRRLTPLECCRLQGFPDWWEDGANGRDSARYKMWGNGIALPCAVDVIGRVEKAISEEK